MAKIKLNNNEYPIPDSTLAPATANFVAHLGTIAGSGMKVVVGGVEYGIDSTKVADAVNKLSELFELLNSPTEPESGFPIAWNSMEVAGNPTLQIEDMPYIKISDYCPTENEIYNSQFTVMPNAAGLSSGTQIFETSEGQDNCLIGDDGVSSFFRYRNNELSYIGFYASPTGKFTLSEDEYEIVFPEPGLYALDLGSLGAEIDMALELVNAPSTDDEILEGDGAEYYTLAPTPLTFRSTAPLNELQEVQINGVTIDPANYTLEEGSTIVTFPIDYLKTLNVGNYEVTIASDSKSVKGGFKVVKPEVNNHGFYYNQPYTAYMSMFGGDTAFFVREDGTYDIITVGKIPDTGAYTIEGNNIVATHPMLGTLTCTISEDGTSVYCNQVATNFELNGSTSIAADDDYIYEYKEDLGGYEVRCIDKTKAEYDAIKTGINGIDTVKLAERMFDDNGHLIDAPIIPNGVTTISDWAFGGCSNLASITIPNSVTTIGNAVFMSCLSLTSVVIPNSVTSIGEVAFSGCSNLTSIVIPSSVTSIGVGAFNGCIGLDVHGMIFEGTMEQWKAIQHSGKIHDMSSMLLHCSDGIVSL